MVITNDAINVTLLPESMRADSAIKPTASKPAHWKDVEGTAFQNPWPSYQHKSLWDAAKFIVGTIGKTPTVPSDITTQIASVRPTWGVGESINDESNNTEEIKATWLGHACFLVELPVRHSSAATGATPSRGARILFDPVFSNRCSPSQWIGPARYTSKPNGDTLAPLHCRVPKRCPFAEPPCEIADVPDVDAIVISHNHYDHLDANTIQAFAKRAHPPHLFAPLGNVDVLRSFGVAEKHIHTLDWWEGRRIAVEVPLVSEDDNTRGGRTTVAFDITCTPSQHQSSRTAFDRYKTLWGSWVVQEVVPQTSSEDSESKGNANPREGVKVYFAGDTGYRAVPPGKNEDEMPTCPAFKEIGDRWNGFDFAMIPIGAYEPREFMSPFHCAPQDSVRIFKDIRAKKALGMHWGTWVLTTEEVTEPPRKLAEECYKLRIAEEDFRVCDLGETLFF